MEATTLRSMTDCISKGEAHRRHEFGQTVSLATTNRRDGFVAALLVEGNPYDGHALNHSHQSITDQRCATGWRWSAAPFGVRFCRTSVVPPR